MILPERVFGRSSVKRIVFGFAIGPIAWATWLRSSVTSASVGSLPARRMTNALTACPVDWDEARLLAQYEAVTGFKTDAVEGGILKRAESEARGYRQMIAVIGDSANAGSVGVHTRCGFQMIGTHPHVGFKFGRWLDTVMMQRALGEGADTLPAAG